MHMNRLFLLCALSLLALTSACGGSGSPLFAELPKLEIRVGQELSYAVPVASHDGEVSLSVEDRPDWVKVEGLKLQFSPSEKELGSHKLKLVATANGASATESLEITVAERPSLMGGLLINGGNKYTHDKDVLLSLWVVPSEGAAPSSVRFSEDGLSFGEALELDPDVEFTHEIPYELSENHGENTVWAEVSDSSGASGLFSASIIYDITLPEGEIEVADGRKWTRERELAVNWNFEDSADTFVEFCFGSFEDSFCVSEIKGDHTFELADQDGLHSLHATATNLAGGSYREVFSVGLDRTPPLVMLTINEGDTFSASPDLTLNIDASDALSGLSDMRVSLDGGGSWGEWQAFSSSHDVSVESEGLWELAVEVRDLAGNSSIAHAALHFDQDAPELSLQLETGYQGSAQPAISFKYTAWTGRQGDEDTLFAEVCLQEDDGAIDCSLSAGEDLVRPWQLFGDDGKRTFTLSVQSWSGARHSISRDIWLDRVVPVLADVILNDGNPYTNLGGVSIAFELEDESADASPITGICFELAGTHHSCHTPNEEMTLFLPDHEGHHSWSAYVIDSARNTSASRSGTIVVDLTPPTIVFLKVNGDTSSNPVVDNQEFTLEMSVSDPAPIEVNVAVYDSNSISVEQNFDDGEEWSSSTDPRQIVLPDEDGVYEVVVRARDRAGNESSKTVMVTLDRDEA